MATVHIDTIQGAECEERSGVIRSIRRRAVVEGLVPNTNEDQVLYDALNDAAMPQPGDAHPNISGLYVRRRTPRAISPTIVEVDLLYRPYTFSEAQAETIDLPGAWYTVRAVTPLAEVETNKDRSGVKIVVSHNDEDQSGFIRVRRPRPSIVIGGRITGSSGSYDTLNSITQFRRTYAGKANSTGWYGDTGASAKTWLCSDVNVQLLELTDTVPQYPIWGVSYVFDDYTDDGTVDPGVVYIDPETGRPPAGLVDGAGQGTGTSGYGTKSIDSYSTVAFNNAINLLDGGP